MKINSLFKTKDKNTLRNQRLVKNKPYASILSDLANIILNSTDKNSIQKIYLFGSYAYGNPNKYSDLDICVITVFYHGENPESIENTIMEKGKLLYER